MKMCTKCKQDKPISEFGKAKLGKDGLRAICKKCHSNINSQWQKENIEILREKRRKETEENPELVSAKRAVYTMNRKEKMADYGKRWRKANQGKVNAKTARRRAAKRNATPKWLNEDHLKQIEAFYIEAARLTKEIGIPHEVDHIVPVKGKNVSGLHVPWNLRVIPRAINRRKSYKF